jgi:hypothetical protein
MSACTSSSVQASDVWAREPKVLVQRLWSFILMSRNPLMEMSSIDQKSLMINLHRLVPGRGASEHRKDEEDPSHHFQLHAVLLRTQNKTDVPKESPECPLNVLTSLVVSLMRVEVYHCTSFNRLPRPHPTCCLTLSTANCCPTICPRARTAHRALNPKFPKAGLHREPLARPGRNSQSRPAPRAQSTPSPNRSHERKMIIFLEIYHLPFTKVGPLAPTL